MATSDEIPDGIGFSGDPGGLGPRAGGADRTHPRGIDVREIKQVIVDQGNPAVLHKQNLGNKAAATPAANPPPDLREIMARLARLETMTVLPGPGHNARFSGGRLELNLVPPDPQVAGAGAGGPNYYGPSGVTDWANPIQPTQAEVVAAILALYTFLGVKPQAGDTILLWPTDEEYVSVTGVCIGPLASVTATRFLPVTISAVEYCFFMSPVLSP